MNHPHEDRLLLFAYGELPEAEAAELETHLVGCAGCWKALERLERARVALEWARPARQRPARWVATGLAAAAVLAAVWVGTRPPSQGTRTWPPSLRRDTRRWDGARANRFATHPTRTGALVCDPALAYS